MIKNLKKNILQLIGITIFIVILFRVDIAKSFQIIYNANLWLVFLACTLVLPITALKSCRWQYLLKIQNIKSLSFWDTFLIYFVGLFWGNITPGKLGGFSKILYLKEKKHSLGKSLYSVLFDYLFDLITIVILGCLGMLLFFSIFQEVLIYICIGFGIFLLGLLIYLFKKQKFNNLLKKTLFSLIPETYRQKTNVNISDFKVALSSLTIAKFLINLVLSLFIWLFYFFQVYILALALGLEINFFYLAGAIAIASFLSLIPITISGIGTRDLVFVTLFSQFNIIQEKSITLSLGILFLIFVTTLLGWIASYLKPLKFNSSSKST